MEIKRLATPSRPTCYSKVSTLTRFRVTSRSNVSCLLIKTLLYPLLLVIDLDMAMSFKDALARLENSRVKSTRPLIPPQILQEDLPL